ncbi:hypothetical protein D043_4062B, partial [Vibrio parahaemolyticus EKP-021]
LVHVINNDLFVYHVVTRFLSVFNKVTTRGIVFFSTRVRYR